MAASTTLITDAKNMVANGATAATLANASSSSHEMQDVLGMLVEYQRHVQEAKVILTSLQGVVDAGDPNAALITNDLATLS